MPFAYKRFILLVEIQLGAQISKRQNYYLISSSSKAYSQRIGALEKRFVDVAKSQAIILYECSFLLMPMVSVRVAGRFDLSPNIIAL